MNLLAAFLQESQEGSPVIGLGLLVGVLLVYAFVAYCLQVIANKTNTENAWFAWIPILNYVLMVNIAKKPVWWVLLFFIPLVNIIILIMVLVAICEARGKPAWLTVVLIIPLVNLFGLGYLAFSD